MKTWVLIAYMATPYGWVPAPESEGWKVVEIGQGIEAELHCMDRKIWTTNIIESSSETRNKYKVECEEI